MYQVEMLLILVFLKMEFLFPKGIYVQLPLTKITAVTLLTDKYSGPGLTA
jgi:hypothetical protein